MAFRIVQFGLASEVRAADSLAPAPGQGEGWGGGRNLAGAVPEFDPPIPACLADRAEPKARLGGRRLGSTGPKHVLPPPLPGEGTIPLRHSRVALPRNSLLRERPAPTEAQAAPNHKGPR